MQECACEQSIRATPGSGCISGRRPRVNELVKTPYCLYSVTLRRCSMVGVRLYDVVLSLRIIGGCWRFSPEHQCAEQQRHLDQWWFLRDAERYILLHAPGRGVSQAIQRLIDKRALLAYKYTGFWQCMDTFKDKRHLDDLNQNAAPWKVWNRVALPASGHTELLSATV